MIVVCGARGNIGSQVVSELARRNLKLRVLSRDPSRLAPSPHEAVKADLLDAASLERAFTGCEKLFLMADAKDLPKAASYAATAAKRAGIRHVVMISSGTILMTPETAIGRWHREAEEIVAAGGLAWTFVRPGNFASNALRWAGMIRTQGKVFAPAGGTTAPIDPRDIGDVAAEALASSGHEGKTYVITGPSVMTTAEQVAAIGSAVGRDVAHIDVPAAAARAGMLKSGMDEVMADAILELIVGGRGGLDRLVTTTVRDVTGHEARPFSVWVHDHIAAFR